MLDAALQTTFETFLGAARWGDVAAFESCFSSRAEGYTSLAGAIQGPHAFGAALKGLNAQLPGVQIEPVRVYGEGPELAARMRFITEGKEAEALFAFRFDADGHIARFIALWDPSDLLSITPVQLDAATGAAVEAYFRTYNENDEEAHMALASPRLTYFGSVSRMTAEGLETARGIFRSAHDRMGLVRLDPIRIFGTGPHLAVLVRIHGVGAGGPMEEGVWVFHMEPQRRFDRVSVLWNPGTFLTWNHR